MVILLLVVFALCVSYFVLDKLLDATSFLINVGKDNQFKKIKYLIFIVLIISILIPLTFSNNTVKGLLNLEKIAEIGDNVGGLTAPFIGGLSCILVFIAFMEQVKANIFLKRQDKERVVIEQLNWLRSNQYDIDSIARDIQAGQNINYQTLNKVVFLISEFTFQFDSIKKELDFDKALSRRWTYTYEIIYKDNFHTIAANLQPLLANANYVNLYRAIAECLSGYTSLEGFLNEIRTYHI